MSARSEQEARRRGKEAPQFSVVERICHGVEVVEMTDGTRQYRVTYERGTPDSPKTVPLFFSTIPEVLNNHERVAQHEVGHALDWSGGITIVSGELQKMGDFSQRLSPLAAYFVSPLTGRSSFDVRRKIAGFVEELKDVTNPHKVAARDQLVVVYERSRVPREDAGEGISTENVQGILESNREIASRMEQALKIAQGVLGRWRFVYDKREGWEELIVKKYEEVVKELEALRSGNLTARAREQAALHISAEKGLFAQLLRINGPEYRTRMMSREIQRLAKFGDHIRAENDKTAEKILEDAASKLWRVVSDREKRLKGQTPPVLQKNSESYLKN